jgi:hypothetical protein
VNRLLVVAALLDVAGLAALVAIWLVLRETDLAEPTSRLTAKAGRVYRILTRKGG